MIIPNMLAMTEVAIVVMGSPLLYKIKSKTHKTAVTRDLKIIKPHMP